MKSVLKKIQLVILDRVRVLPRFNILLFPYSLGGKDEQTDLVISFDSALGTSSGTSRVVTDRVRAATGIPILIYFYCISKILLHFTIFKIF